MDKSDDAFRTIGEMSRELNVKTHILRYWEEQFPTLNPLKRAGGRRHYRREDVSLLKTINRLLNDEGYTIKGARKYLSKGSGDSASAGFPITSDAQLSVSGGDQKPAFDFDRLRDIRDRLSSALESASR